MERKRDVLHVLEQYERTVKPSFAQFILPTKQFAHIIVRTCLHAMVNLNCNALELISHEVVEKANYIAVLEHMLSPSEW